MVDHRKTDWQNGDPEATVLAPWSKRKQENEPEAFRPTEISHAPDLPIPPAQIQDRPARQRQRKLGRRQLLIGGIAAATVAAASAVTLETVFNRPKSQPVRPTPTPIPGPRTFVAGKAVANITGHSDTVNVVAWDPSGRYLASAGQDTTVMLWDLGNILQKPSDSLQTLNQPMRQWKFAQAISASNMAWAPDGGSIAVSASELGKFYLLNAMTDKSTPQPIVNSASNTSDPVLQFDQPIYAFLSWEPHTNIIAAVEQTIPSQVKVDYWQADKLSTPLGSYTYNDPSQTPDDPVGLKIVNWSLDGSLLAGLLTNVKVVVWNTQKKNVQTVLELPDRLHGQSPFVYRFALTWSPIDPNVFAVFDMDIIAIFDVRKSQPLYLLGTNDIEAHTPPPNTQSQPWTPQVHGIAWSPNGRYIAASYSRSTRISVWDLNDPNPQMQDGIRLQQVLFPQANEPGHNSTVFDLTWSPDGRYLATGSYDRTIIVWQVDKS